MDIKNACFRLFILCLLIIAVLQILRHFYGEEERKVRTQVRDAIKEQYPEAADELMARYGLKPYEKPDSTANDNTNGPAVILVHGLDEPGKVWMNLAPVLYNKGFSVWLMTYPNDQPVTESARFFLKQLNEHNLSGKKKCSLVAHSMGGLVSRDMLTNPEFSYAEKAGKEEVPVIDQLIMVGTPNHGSEFARFHILGEFRDQFVTLLKGNYHWLQGILDGAGEAGIDLIPGSVFLTQLNSRSHPENTNMMVIAAVMTPVQKSDFKEFTQLFGKKLQKNTRAVVNKLEDAMLLASETVGDGLVSVDSARLPEIPLKMVQGTHLSMIRNILADSQRIPPAIPIILEQLSP